jgi:protein-disulfide isomerase
VTDLRSAPVPPLRDDDHVRGPVGTPPTFFYADFTCPHCAVEALRLRDAGARVVFRHFAIKARDPRAVPLALAAEAAGRQGAFWAFHDALYEDQGHVDDPHLWRRCEALGLDLERFQADRRDDAIVERVRRDVREALRAGATTTPAIFVEGELIH